MVSALFLLIENRSTYNILQTAKKAAKENCEERQGAI